MTELPIPRRQERAANPAFVAILKDVKTLLWDGVDPETRPFSPMFICEAIDESCGPDSSDAVALQHDIGASLGDSSGGISYGVWLFDTLGQAIWEAQIRRSNSRAQIQSGRLRWIDQLIEEYGGVV